MTTTDKDRRHSPVSGKHALVNGVVGLMEADAGRIPGSGFLRRDYRHRPPMAIILTNLEAFPRQPAQIFEITKLPCRHFRQIGDATPQPKSARGISPRAAHRSVREPLNSYGSCHSPKTAVFRRDLRAPPVSRWPMDPSASDPPPSLHPHYRDFITTTGQSAPVRRIGTFSLVVLPLAPFPLASTTRFSSSVH